MGEHSTGSFEQETVMVTLTVSYQLSQKHCQGNIKLQLLLLIEESIISFIHANRSDTLQIFVCICTDEVCFILTLSL